MTDRQADVGTPAAPDAWSRPGVRHREAAFLGVGAAGFAVQLGVLAALVEGAGWHYEMATVFAVGAALAHNFSWHRRWTWRDRPLRGLRILTAFAEFVLANGLVSLAGNLILMRLLVGLVGLPVLVANMVAVAICGFVNFQLADRHVFRRPDARGLRFAGHGSSTNRPGSGSALL